VAGGEQPRDESLDQRGLPGADWSADSDARDAGRADAVRRQLVDV
jgi:hypothetical protein